MLPVHSLTCALTSVSSPRSLRAMAGMTDPQVSSWSHLGIALARENTDTSDNAQGVTTDGAFWYVVANGEDGLAPVIGVYDNAHQTVKKLFPTAEHHSKLIDAYDGTPRLRALFTQRLSSRADPAAAGSVAAGSRRRQPDGCPARCRAPGGVVHVRHSSADI